MTFLGLLRCVPRLDLLVPVRASPGVPGHGPAQVQARHRGGGLRVRGHVGHDAVGQGGRTDAGWTLTQPLEISID